MTTPDLLERFERYEPIPPVKDRLTKEQLNTILDSYEENVYEHVRDRAMIAFYAAVFCSMKF